MQHQRRYVKGKTIHVREPHVWSNTGSKYYYQIIKPSGASRFALGKPRLNLASDHAHGLGLAMVLPFFPCHDLRGS
jgi:hypothetical protein